MKDATFRLFRFSLSSMSESNLFCDPFVKYVCFIFFSSLVFFFRGFLFYFRNFVRRFSNLVFLMVTQISVVCTLRAAVCFVRSKERNADGLSMVWTRCEKRHWKLFVCNSAFMWRKISHGLASNVAIRQLLNEFVFFFNSNKTKTKKMAIIESFANQLTRDTHWKWRCQWSKCVHSVLDGLFLTFCFSQKNKRRTIDDV